MSFIVREFLDDRGRSPFRDWLVGLDRAVRARIQARIVRFEMGNLGDLKHLGGGVWEARLAFGPGYRVYLGKSGQQLVLLLLGGDKGSRTEDIRRAQEYWAKYLKETRDGKTK